MRKVREVLRLRHACGVSVRTIAQSVGVGHTTVGEYLRRTAVIGITWPVPAEVDDAELERRLFTPRGFYTEPTRALPDWNHVHAELRRRSVTLLLLWEEYRAGQPEGYGYSRFCGLYKGWQRGVSASMRQTHVAGEKLFVDYAGDTVPVFDGATGEERRAHVFVAVLGASNYTYAEARWSEGLADWIGSHVNALAFLGGVPKLLVCDNLRAGVTAACRYEPGINRTYQDLAAHYGTAVLPARVRRPRDKAKVETAVQIVQRFILARLRNRRVPVSGRAERGDAGAARRPQRAPDAQARREPAGVLRHARSSGADAAAAGAVRLCRMAALPGRARLPRRGARAFLLGAVATDPRGDRGAHHRHHDRGVPFGHACGGAPSVRREAATYDDARAHAERAPSLRELDAGADAVLCRTGGARDGRTGRDDHAHQAASGAGFSRLPRHSAAGQDVRRDPA